MAWCMRRGATLAAAMLLAGGCALSDSSTEVPEPNNNVRAPARDASGPHLAPLIVDTFPLEALLYAAPIAVQGSVTDVQGPFWNQADGQKWVDDAANPNYTDPTLYREITISVSSVLRDDLGVVNDILIIRAYGGGTPEEGEAALRGGNFVPGEEIVVLLSQEAFFMREGPIDWLIPLLGFQSVLHVHRTTDLVTLLPETPVDPFPLAVFLTDLASSRLTPHPEWDDLRFGRRDASEIEELLAREEQRLEERRQSPTSVTVEPIEP